MGKGVEELMVKRALKAARRSDVCLLVIDATEGLSEQEARLGTFVEEAGRACVVVINKWDLVSNKDDRLYRSSKNYIESKLGVRRPAARSISPAAAPRSPRPASRSEAPPPPAGRASRGPSASTSPPRRASRHRTSSRRSRTPPSSTRAA